MKVILLEDVRSLGKKGDLVKVNDGYARNYIIPKKLGVEATNKSINDLKLKKASEAKKAQELYEAALAFKEDVKDKSVTIPIRAGEGGRVFGSVSSKEIASAWKEQRGIEIDKKKLVQEEAIKALGVYNVPYRVHPKVTAELKVRVVAAQ